MASSSSSPSQSRFFKIMMSETLHNRRLRIPRKFARQYGEALSNPEVVLKLPSGLEWKVGLTTSHHKVWLNKRWHEFAKYCNLGEGHLLVFQYLGNLCFDTLIFDKSATEIEYPCNVAKKEPEKVGDSKYDVSVEILDRFLSVQTRKEKHTPPGLHPHKKLKKEVKHSPKFDSDHVPGKEYEKAKDFKDAVSVEILDYFPSFQSPKGKSTQTKKDGSYAPGFGSDSDRGKYFTEENVVRKRTHTNALEKAKAFCSINPYFLLIMRRSMLQSGNFMHVPNKFVRDYLNEKIDQVKIKDSDGRTWNVKCWWYKNRNVENSQTSLQFKDWAAVAKGYSLKVNDVCVFEMIQDDPVLFNLFVFPCRAEESESTRVELEKTDIKFESCDHKQFLTADERASAFNSLNPSFKVYMHPSYVNGHYLNIPRSFFKMHIKDSDIKDGDVMLRTLDGRAWSAAFCLTKSKRQLEIGQGWTMFMRENNLNEGDVCVFELVEGVAGNVTSFNVFIFHGSENVNHGS